jgi:hypothetical protein
MNASGSLPRSQGITPAGDVVRDSAPLPVVSRDVGLLGELAGDWRFFNHGALYRDGKLDADPIAELDVPVRVLKLARPVFEGIGRTFGHALLMTPAQYWPDLLQHLRTIAMLTPDGSCYREARAIDLQITDPAVHAAAVIPVPVPRLHVVAFGFVGSDVTVDFEVLPDPRLPARAITLPPCPACVAILAAYRAGKPDPLAAGEI